MCDVLPLYRAHPLSATTFPQPLLCQIPGQSLLTRIPPGAGGGAPQARPWSYPHQSSPHSLPMLLYQCVMKLCTTAAESVWWLLHQCREGRINNYKVPGPRLGCREALHTCTLLGTPNIRDKNYPKPRCTPKRAPHSRKRRPTAAGCFWGIGLGCSPPAMPVSGCWYTGSRGGPRPRRNSYTGPHASLPLARRSSNT